MPVPARPSFQELLTGDWDSQFIELDGIVRGIHPLSDGKEKHLLFDVVVGTWRVLAQLPGTWSGPLPEHLVDAKVRIRGVAGTLFNQQRQLVGTAALHPVARHGDDAGAVAARSVRGAGAHHRLAQPVGVAPSAWAVACASAAR